uniref:PRA1 family protein n=1 Tax=Equus asinus asinus TaxID=83772 RepID=A0A8C4LAD1_EQUAS
MAAEKDQQKDAEAEGLSATTLLPKLIPSGVGREWLERRRATIRPWGAFVDQRRFSRPRNLGELCQRLVRNVEYYQSNYVFVFLGLIVYCVGHPRGHRLPRRLPPDRGHGRGRAADGACVRCLQGPASLPSQPARRCSALSLMALLLWPRAPFSSGAQGGIPALEIKPLPLSFSRYSPRVFCGVMLGILQRLKQSAWV